MSRLTGLIIAGTGVLAFGLAGCGSDSGSGSGSGNAAAGGTPSTTVGVRSISSTGTTLVDSSGRTLYMTDQDTATKIACDNMACTSIWKPLTVASGQKPTGPQDVSAKLSTVKRPDGTSQVAYDSHPLYTFALDKAAGDATGNNAKDSFGGPELTWHAVTTGGPAPAQSTQPSSGGGGGYGY
jgi:predicted lipoprotein with Yx(FWY)xxD motif